MLDKYLGDLTGEEGEQRMSQLPATEQRNPASAQLDEMPTGDIVRLMNEEDRKVPEAVGEALPRIAEAVDLLVNAWKE
jgi:N-acetylmuramic acid 6-phosphate etherase